jgi:hypothetical protein
MTTLPLKDNLIEDVWQYLPPSKYLLGRKGVATMVERIIAAWEPAALLPTDRPVEASEVAGRIHERVSGQYGTIWLIVFQALISIAIQVLIDWWFAGVVTRTIITQWHGELVDE